MAAKTFEAQLDAAIASWHAGDADRAIATLEPLAVRYPDEHSIRGVLGSYYADSGDLSQARPHLEAAVQLDPTRELWARALFHVYLDLHQIQEARAELRRFQSITTSDELRNEWNGILRDLDIRFPPANAV